MAEISVTDKAEKDEERVQRENAFGEIRRNLVSLCKGLEQYELVRVSEIIQEGAEGAPTTNRNGVFFNLVQVNDASVLKAIEYIKQVKELNRKQAKIKEEMEAKILSNKVETEEQSAYNILDYQNSYDPYYKLMNSRQKESIKQQMREKK